MPDKLLCNLLDVNLLERHSEVFFQTFKIPHGIQDADEEWIVQKGWQPTCVDFFRANEKACELCRLSDRRIINRLSPGRFETDICDHGLEHVAFPIVIDGEHLGTFWMGQFFYSEPDREFFREKALQYHFDTNKFEAALDKCLILERTEVEKYMGYFMSLVEMFKEIASESGRRQKIENERSLLKERLFESDKFNRMLAHDLRTPFASIISLSDLLIEESDSIQNESLTTLAIAISESSLSTLNLLENLLSWFRNCSGMLDFSPERIDLRQIIQDCLEVYGRLILDKSLKVQVEAETSVFCLADRKMLQTVVRNLLSNAIKFSRPNGTVRLIAKESNQGISFSIEDDGVGMSSLQMEAIRNNDTASTVGTMGEIGSGVGFLLINEFLRKHDSFIQIESIQGSGTKVSFVLNS